MVTLRELEEAIRECETAPANYTNCTKLAVLYTVRHYMYGGDPPPENYSTYSTTSLPIQPKPEESQEKIVADYGEGEFYQVIAGMLANKAWRVMAELMETLHIVNPRLYEGVLRKLQ